MPIAAEHEKLFQGLVALIRTASQLQAQDVGFLRAADRGVRVRSERASARILQLAQRVAVAGAGDELDASGPQDLFARWRGVENVFDTLVERVDVGLAADAEGGASAGTSAAPSPAPTSVGSPAVPFYDKTIEKPQEKFAAPVDNSLGPFRPLLAEKPHATVSLADALRVREPDAEHAGAWYEQPYATEIAAARYPAVARKASEAVPPRAWDATPLTFVDRPKQLRKLVAKLAKADAIAVDLEHHDLRSYLGLVSLMQISTATEDWIVDTLALRTELQALNEVFANPKILKVLHGAQRDVLWLQRDLGLYVVGLADTFHAARALGLPRHSLAYLLQSYVDFEADKKYQRADWRVRPLTPEMTNYARADTHFLLYIWQRMRNELLAQAKLDEVLENSRATAAQRYEKPEWNADPGWVKLATRFRLTPHQTQVFAAIYQWRDGLARDADESPHFLLANELLMTLAVAQPTTASGVVSAHRSVSPFVRNHAVEIAEIIAKAKDVPAASKVPAATEPEQATPLLPATSDVFSTEAIALAERHRLDKPTLFAPLQSTQDTRPLAQIFLGTVSLDALPSLEKAAPEEDALENAVPSAASSPAHDPEVSETPGLEGTEAVHEVNGKGKRKRAINVVSSFDDDDAAALAAPAARTKRPAPDADAAPFDFAAAAPLLAEPERADGSFRRFGGGKAGPQAAKGRRRAGKAQSRTFKR